MVSMLDLHCRQLYTFYLGYKSISNLQRLNSDIIHLICDIYITKYGCRWDSGICGTNVKISEDGLFVRKVSGGVDWNAACIANNPNFPKYKVRLVLPDLDHCHQSSCVMVGLSEVEEVDYKDNKPYSYNRGYYIMIWQYKVVYYGIEHENIAPSNSPSLFDGCEVVIEYLPLEKKIAFLVNGVLLNNNPFNNVVWKNDYHLVALLCCENDGVRILSS